MRFRYILSILSVLVPVTLLSVYLYTTILEREKRELIDQQVRDTATTLIDSELVDLRIVEFEKADKIISEELGESRIGKFFIIRNSKNEIIFISTGAKLLGIHDLPRDPQWFSRTYKGKYIRGLNLSLPRVPDRTLQVGVVIDEKLVHPAYFNQGSLIFILAILVVGLSISFVLATFLLVPIARLDSFLTDALSNLRPSTLIPELPNTLLKQPTSYPKDEFTRVLISLNQLIEKVNGHYKLSRLWAYQMAHELKTPLSNALIQLENLQKTVQADAQIQTLRNEFLNIDDTINSFLGWAEIENSETHKFLFANKASEALEKTIRRLPDHERIVVAMQEDLIIPANPAHLEQLFSNILSNSLKYSSGKISVIGNATEGTISIIDEGVGIPDEVLQRIGEPFNKKKISDDTKTSHGLGLAWVYSICKLYGWPIRIVRRLEQPGTLVAVTFDNERVNEV